VVALQATPAPAGDEAERRRLRAKVDELKHLLKDRNEERASLRRQLAKVNDAMAAESPEADRAADADEEDDDDEGTVEAPRTLLIPTVAPGCGDELRGLPMAVARKALTTVASLAAADAAAWRQVKKMASAAEPLFTCRVGIHHRVVFRVGGGELAVLAAVHRKDLEGAIRRHGRTAPR
jgi:hypothetical protein